MEVTDLEVDVLKLSYPEEVKCDRYKPGPAIRYALNISQYVVWVDARFIEHLPAQSIR